MASGEDDDISIVDTSNSTSMSSRRSAVWAYFTIDNFSDRDWVTCDLCKPLNKKIKTKQSSTSNLRSHLRTHHPQQFSLLLSKAQSSDNSDLDSTDTSPAVSSKRRLCGSQPSITAMFERQTKYEKTSKRYKELTDSLTALLAGQMLPFMLVDTPEFRDFVSKLDPRYNPPNRKYFSEIAIPAKYNEIKADVISSMKRAKYFSCTADGWSSCTTEPYLSLTVHFITDDWKLATCCLRTLYMPDSHTGENIASMVRSILREYDCNLSEVVSITTDSGANMVKACKELQVVRIPCFGHILHNSINNAVKNCESVQSMLKLCRQIVSTFSHSFKMKSEMRKKQKDNDLPLRALVGEVSTRWGSKFQMVERIYENRLVLSQMLLSG